ncbi:LuxR C-terminal-related transcriptional regulator [Rhodococcus jostii]|uniref:ATP-, maltotriose-and DNA-dependent transcriptional regulator MalT n=4 Tax=Rhodococcus jostii TaxID=132919 RepID=A0A1H4J6X7_RHOJO|nr:LuxR family transcriptional regulator [Rhodococcus jostii]SEB42013.1 ATP-, maltotriose-and DNA-dependent transcriptional regulator MalT [Rhodococcus jostii]
MEPSASMWPLVGRGEELRLINTALTGADGYGGVVIAGPPGVGKTRLADEALADIRPGRWVSRWARATASARALPLGAFAEWTGDIAQDPMLVVRGVIDHLTIAPNGAKVVVGVDDAHLLDDLSAFVLLQLVQRRLASVVVTIRTGESAPDAVTALWKDRHLQRIELQPLSEEETGHLLTTILGGALEPTAALRLWHMTRGNALYLRHLVEQELRSGRLSHSQGAWIWSGQPVVSPGLADLIDSQIGRLPDTVGAVLDFLAVGEPLTEEVLADLTGADAVEAAHTAGLITVEHHGRHEAHLAHPLYGEARRAQATPLRLRCIRSRIAAALADEPDSGTRDLVRRAVLTLESDLPSDPPLFMAAAAGALSLFDADLAERLADAAVSTGGGCDAQFLRASALMNLSRTGQAEEVLAQISTEDLTDEQIVDIACLRTVLLLVLNRPTDAVSVIDEATQCVPMTMRGSLIAGHAGVASYEGRPLDALNAAERALRSPNVTDIGTAWALNALVVALGDLGRADQMAPIAARARDLTASSSRLSAYRFPAGDYHARGLRLAGHIAEAEKIVTDLCREVADVPGWVQSMSSMLMGQATLAAGRLTETRKLLEQPFPYPDEVGYIPAVWNITLTQARAMLGDHMAAAESMHKVDSLCRTFAYRKPEQLLACAWVAAAGGATTPAIELAHQGAAHAAEHEQHAVEMLCLHTATRFGDTTTAHRLHELASQVDGPRAPAAALHAAALAAGNPDGLRNASAQFEEMGDLLSAMDAAAHAATTYRSRGRNGSALTAAARAQRLADTCGGADTPALREAQQPSPLTARQREVITLAAQGLSNKQIAEKMTLSVRTIEGHLHRAALKTGVSGRGDLGATITGE